jgi:predicted HTH transcriptional regulator
MKIASDEIRRLGETQSVEFKKSLSLQKEAFESLCGMVNTNNAKGKVIFGVTPDNSICGIEPGNLDTVQKSLVQSIRNKFDPPIICSVEILECDDKSLILLQAERNRAVAYHEYDGKAYIREGSSNRQLSYAEKQQLMTSRNRDKHTGPWKCDRCGSVVGMLMSIVITDQGVSKSYDCECGGQYWPM